MCTSFRLTATDGSVCIARTMEFPDMLGARVTVIPRSTTFTSVTPDGPGATWTTRHGIVGMDAVGNPRWLSDGMNEQGLYAGLLYMPGFARYPSPEGVPANSLVSNLDVIALLLGTCATVAEAFEAASHYVIWGQPQGLIGGTPPIHIVLHDALGESGVIEFRDGAQSHVNNPLGVATNAPYLDWHLNNVRLHLPSLQAENPAPVSINQVAFEPLSQGQGFLGLPGDGSSPSRFLRAAALVMTMTPAADAPGQEVAALHAVNNFDIPDGAMRGTGSTGLSQNDRTTWSSVSSLSAKRYIVRVESNPTPVVIDFATTDLTPGAPRQVSLASGTFAPLVL